MKLSGANVPLDTLLLALIADAGKINVWMQTQDGYKGKNRPKSIMEALLNVEKEKPLAFDSPEAFMEWRAKIMGG